MGDDDEATQVPAASAKMESGRATTDSERERGRARKGGERDGGRGRARETATNFSAGFLDDHSLARSTTADRTTN